MRIIDPKPQKSAETEMTCYHCGCLFAFVRADTYWHTESSYCDSDSYKAVDCPKCEEPLKV